MTIENALARIVADLPEFLPGHVWLAGAGPGDPRYLTVEVIAALTQADVIVHDALVSSDILALAPGAEIVFAGKRGGKPSAVQEDITAALVDLARQNRRVLRLKGGDPFIFGRGGEEALVLRRENIPFRILPGMTSALTALASANIPATMRGISRAITMVTGHAAGEEGDTDWAALARTGEPLVVYMGLKNIRIITRLLMEGGRAPATPAAVIMSATTPDERIAIATLATIADEAERQQLAAPALIVIGEIVSLRETLSSLPEKPPEQFQEKCEAVFHPRLRQNKERELSGDSPEPGSAP